MDVEGLLSCLEKMEEAERLLSFGGKGLAGVELVGVEGSVTPIGQGHFGIPPI